MTTDPKRCEFSGCKYEARWLATKLWGKGGTIRTCDDHRPGSLDRPETLRNLPVFYRVELITT